MQKKLLIIFMLCIFLFPLASSAAVCGTDMGSCSDDKNCCKRTNGPGFICLSTTCPTQPLMPGASSEPTQTTTRPANVLVSCEKQSDCADGLSCSIVKKQCVKEIPDFFNLNGKIGSDNVNTLIARIIKYTLGIVGTLTLIFFIYGGLIWMTSAGNESKVKKGAKTMGYAFIGLFMILASYLLVDFILKILGE